MPRPRAMRRPFSELAPADYKLFLAAMREDKLKEYPLISWGEVGAWLVRFKFLKTMPHVSTLYRYKRYGMPIGSTPRPSHGSRKQPWTTNLMLQCWIATQGRALTLPRWHPFRKQVEAAYSTKPSAVRMRRMNKRRLVAKIAAKRALANPKPVRPEPASRPAPRLPVHTPAPAVTAGVRSFPLPGSTLQ